MWSSRLRKRAAAPPSGPISVAPSGDFAGNDGPWSLFPIKIGTPPQTIKALISTASSQTWAVLPEGCVQNDPANCSTSRGGVFRPDSSSSWNQNQDVAGGLFPLTLETNLNLTGVGLYGYDTVSLDGQGSNGSTLKQQVVAGVATKAYYLGLFGLNPHSAPLPESSAPLPNYLSSLNQSGLIPSLSWSYTAGNQYRPGPVYGSLTLGGYDRSRFVPNDVSFPFNGTDARSLTVNVGEIILITDDTFTVIETRNKSLLAAIDSTTPYMILPLNVCQQFEEAFGITWNKDVQGYLVNDKLHNSLQSRNTSVILNLGNSSTTPGEGFNITLPYAAFDLIAGPPLLKNASRYFPLMRAANDSQTTLGRTFLQEAYLIADYERKNFTVSQCNWDSNAKSQIVPIRRPGEITILHIQSHQLIAGAIAGIIIGILAFVILAVFLGILFKRKYHPSPKKQKPRKADMTIPELPSGNGPYEEVQGHPKSPELEGKVHKGHELEAPDQEKPPGFHQEPIAQDYPHELDANPRRSPSQMFPISLTSPRSEATRLSHPQRHISDPPSLSSERSLEGYQRKRSSPFLPS